MKCPHCLIAFHARTNVTPINTDKDGGWVVAHTVCPECGRVTMFLNNGDPTTDTYGHFAAIRS